MSNQTKTEDHVLHLQNVCKDYRQGRSVVEVLRNINLSVKRGELVGIVGASGSGKSTLLHIAGVLDRNFTGKLLINGTSINAANSKECDALRLNHVGFIYQYHHLLSDFNARDNVAMPRFILGKKAEESLEEADKLLAKLGLSKRSFNYPGELSGGEQQRVAIARSIINGPQIVLADEPTGNLDSAASENVIQIFLELAKERGLSAIIVTHNHQIAKKMDRVYELRNGELL
jgi:lipoprotein-releasing system ATP-binding protein